MYLLSYVIENILTSHNNDQFSCSYGRERFEIWRLKVQLGRFSTIVDVSVEDNQKIMARKFQDQSC